jgi:tetratricopeptide (TPR) repeat protein
LEEHPENLPYVRHLAVQWIRLGGIQAGLRRWEEARKSFKSALSIAETQMKADPRTAQWHMDFATVQHHLASLARDEGNLSAAAGNQKASALKFQELADDNKANLEWQRSAVLGWKLLAEIQVAGSDHASSETSWRKALEVSGRLQSSGDAIKSDLKNQVIILEGIGVSLSFQGNLDASDAGFREALQVNARVLKLAPDDRDCLRTEMVLNSHFAGNKAARMNYRAAEQDYREALLALERSVKRHGSDEGSDWDLHALYVSMADVITAQARLPEAETFLENNVALCRKHLSPDISARRWWLALAEALLGIQDVRLKSGKLELAEKEAREAVSILADAVRRQPSDAEARLSLQQAWCALGGVLVKRGAHAEAEASYRKGIDILRAMVQMAPKDMMLRVGLSVALAGLSDCAAARGAEGMPAARDALRESAEIFFKLKKEGLLTPDMLKGEPDMLKALKDMGLPPP